AGDLVISVVRLPHAAVLDHYFFAQHVAETVDDAALRLCREIARLHRDPGIDGDPDVVQFDLPASAIDRNFSHTGRKGVILDHRRYAKPAVRARTLPVRHLGNGA